MWRICIQRCIHTTNLGFLPKIIDEICSWHDYSRNDRARAYLILLFFLEIRSRSQNWYMTLPFQDATTYQIWDLSSNNMEKCSKHDHFKNWVRGQCHSDPRMVCDTWPPQDTSTHQIWNSYLKEYRSYAPDLMPILETRSEVKVIVTGKWNGTIRHSKMHSHTDIGILTLNN